MDTDPTDHPTRPDDVAVLSRVESAAALLDEDRRRLVAALRQEPDSASGLARRLGDSRQRLNHHLRTLEEAGLVELHEERRKGNCVERVMRVVARRFVLDPGSVEGLPAEWLEAGDAFSATYLVALAARTIRELGALEARARAEEKRLATASLDTTVELASPGAMAEFVEDLSRAVGEVVARHHCPSGTGRSFRVVAGVHPRRDAHSEETAEEEAP